MAEFDFRQEAWCLRGFRAVIVNIWLGGQDVTQAAHGGGAALKNIGDPAEGDHRQTSNVRYPLKAMRAPREIWPRKKLMAALHMSTIKRWLPMSA